MTIDKKEQRRLDRAKARLDQMIAAQDAMVQCSGCPRKFHGHVPRHGTVGVGPCPGGPAR